jgi:hypothetical protein
MGTTAPNSGAIAACIAATAAAEEKARKNETKSVPTTIAAMDFATTTTSFDSDNMQEEKEEDADKVTLSSDTEDLQEEKEEDKDKATLSPDDYHDCEEDQAKRSIDDLRADEKSTTAVDTNCATLEDYEEEDDGNINDTEMQDTHEATTPAGTITTIQAQQLRRVKPKPRSQWIMATVILVNNQQTIQAETDPLQRQDQTPWDATEEIANQL